MFTQEEIAGFLRKNVAAQINATGRKCGSCSLCCKLLDIDDRKKGTGDLVKTAHAWCKYCKPNRTGCAIYETRPATCVEYACQWLLNPEMDEMWYPLKCGMITTFVPREAAYIDGQFIVGGTIEIIVNSGAESRWKSHPYLGALMSIAAAGLSSSPHRYVKLFEKNKTYVILPQKFVEIKGKDDAYTIVPLENGTAEVIQGNVDYVLRLTEVMTKCAEFVQNIEVPPRVRAVLPAMSPDQRLATVMEYATPEQLDQFKKIVSGMGEAIS